MITNHDYYDKVIKFRPEVGKKRDIDLVREIDQVSKLNNRHTQALENLQYSRAGRLAEEINRRQRNVLYQLRQK